MASIIRTDGGRFVARVRVMVGGRLVRRAATFPNLSDAKLWADQLERLWEQPVTRQDRLPPRIVTRRKGGE